MFCEALKAAMRPLRGPKRLPQVACCASKRPPRWQFAENPPRGPPNSSYNTLRNCRYLKVKKKKEKQKKRDLKSGRGSPFFLAICLCTLLLVFRTLLHWEKKPEKPRAMYSGPQPVTMPVLLAKNGPLAAATHPRRSLE